MKRLTLLLLFLALVGGLAWFVRHRSAVHEDAPENAAVTEAEAPPGTLTLTAEQQTRLGLAGARPRVTSLSPQASAYGRVLDPSPLALLASELDTAESAQAASRAESERSEGLFRSGENVARKNVETAAAQFRADTIKVLGLRQRLRLEWGEDIAELDTAARQRLVAGLVAGTTALARVDLPAGDTLPATPAAARLLILGQETQPLQTTHLAPASTVDPKTQAQGFILRVEEPPFPLRPGMALSALLALPGDPQPVVVIPRSAVVRHDGRPWVFVQHGEEEFVRREITLDEAAEDGWLVRLGVTPEDTVVVTGAQALLSRQMLGAGGAED